MEKAGEIIARIAIGAVLAGGLAGCARVVAMPFEALAAGADTLASAGMDAGRLGTKKPLVDPLTHGYDMVVKQNQTEKREGEAILAMKKGEAEAMKKQEAQARAAQAQAAQQSRW